MRPKLGAVGRASWSDAIRPKGHERASQTSPEQVQKKKCLPLAFAALPRIYSGFPPHCPHVPSHFHIPFILSTLFYRSPMASGRRKVRPRLNSTDSGSEDAAPPPRAASARRGGRTAAAAAAASVLPAAATPIDHKATARALMDMMRPELAAMLAPSVTASTAGGATAAMGSASEEAVKNHIDATMPGLVRASVKAEIQVLLASLPSLVDFKSAAAVWLRDTLKPILSDLLLQRGVERMSTQELRTAVNSVFTTAKIRGVHAASLMRRILALLNDPSASGVFITFNFPPVHKVADYWTVIHFNKVVYFVYHTLLVENGALPVDKQPHIIRGRSNFNPTSINRVDDAALSVTRNTINDGRSTTRGIFFAKLAASFEEGSTCEQPFPDAAMPEPSEAAGHQYFAYEMTLLVSDNGEIPAGCGAAGAVADPGDGAGTGGAADGSETDVRLLPPGLHRVKRTGCLVNLAKLMLQALVRSAHIFDERVLFAVACSLRLVITSDDKSWMTLSRSQVENARGPCCWATMLPRLSRRVEMRVEIHTMSPEEREALVADEGGLADDLAAATAANDGGDNPDWF